MDFRHLHHFSILAETGSLHGAARRLRLQQPALSQSIRALEIDVGVRLVERSPTGTRLTYAGKAFLAETRFILAATNRAVHIAKLAADTAVPLCLGFPPDIVSHRLVTLMRIFRQANPENSLIVKDASTAQLSNMLSGGLLDLVLLPTIAASDRIADVEILWNDDVYPAMPPSHPLAAHAAIDLRLLTKEAFITKPDHELDATDQVLLEGCRAAGVTPTIAATTQHPEVRLALVAAGFGLTALPITRLERQRDSVVLRPTIPPLHMSVAASWPVSGPNTQAQRFIEQARSLVTGENHPPAEHRATPD